MAKVSPTQRTLKRMRDSGDYLLIKIVEHWNSHAFKRMDLWNFDILGISITGETHAIQVTSYSNVNARIKKIEESEYTPHLRDADWVLLVEGWKKEKNGRYKSYIADLS